MKFFPLLAAVLLPQVVAALEVRLDFRWHDQALTIPSQQVTTAQGEVLAFSRLDFLLNEPVLEFASRDPLAFRNWHHYVHGASPDRLTLPSGPGEPITRLTLHLGGSPPGSKKHPNQYPHHHALSRLRNGLYWEPIGGYRFFSLEGQLRSEDTAFTYHYGNRDERVALTFEGSFDPEGSYQLTLHLDRLFRDSFRVADRTSTHSRPGDPVLPHFRKALPAAFTLTPLSEELQAVAAPSTATRPSTNRKGNPHRLRIPDHFPAVGLPQDYPLTRERIRLGRELFFETALSKNTATSCASCHPAGTAFADNTPRSFGFLGEKTKRHSMPLMNLVWKKTPFFWDGRKETLRAQVLKPIEDPLEMGESIPDVLTKLDGISYYPRLFRRAFGDAEITEERLAVALEQFMLSLTSTDSKFDRVQKEKAAFTPLEKKGFDLFMSENDPTLGLRGGGCFHCHSGTLFTNHRFHNNGLPPLNDDWGREQATGLRSDRFKFSTPSLRNVAITAPYMHDGRFETLAEVIAHYSAGVHRSPTLNANLARHPDEGLNFDHEEQAALVAFLRTLSDPRFQEPSE